MSRCCVAEIVVTSFVWATAAATAKDPTLVRSVWVVRGGRAELPCTPTPKHKQDSAVLVLWYRSSDTVPVYSYDARESEFTSGVPWADEGALGGRAHYTPESEPPTLVLEPAHARDQGMYTCRVDYRLSPSTRVIFNLTVVIPAGPPTILWGGRGIVDVVGPLSEGQRADLSCRSDGGRPPPILTWTRRGRQIPLLRNQSVTDENTGTARVSASISLVGSREHLGSTLSCHSGAPPFVPRDLLPSQTASVVVNVTLAPVEVRILGSGTAATAGTDLRLVCRAAGSHPPALMAWWRGHARLSNVTHGITDGGNVSTATLMLRVDRSYNGVTLVCTASNPALPNVQRISDSIRLNVFYPPVVRLSLGRPLDPDSIKEGDDVYFECSIVSNPAFHRVDWRHNGVVVSPNVSSGVVVSGLSLVLRNLRRHHSGSYTCGASNLEGYNTSNAVSLSVRHTPVCAGGRRERTQGAARGSTASVRCTVEAEPSDGLSWSWTRKRPDGSEEAVPEKDVVRSGGLTSSVLVTPRAHEDYGRFLCLASNAVGRQASPCVVALVPAGPPDTPTNCSVSPAADTAATGATAALSVACLEGFDGDLPQHFTLETWQDGSLVSNLTSLFPEWVVTGLRAGVGVTLRVAAHNARGRSDVIRFEVHTAIPQQRLAPDSEWGLLGVPPLLGALVGVGGVLLVVLVTGVIIVKYTRRAQPPTHVHTLVMTPTARPDNDTYDPDVVSSLRRHTDNLDVLPSSDAAHKPASGKSHAHGRQAAASRPHAHGQTVTKACVNRQGSRNASITRGFCLHRQDSPLPDSDGDDSDDSDSDSTFTDLTAAGRAAAAVPPAARRTNSLPRAARREEFRHAATASSSLDLQLRACQRSQVVPCLARGRMASSAEELHPLVLSRDLRQLLSSGDLRHVSLSGTELRVVGPAAGTWPPFSSSSGELRLPLPSSGALRAVAAEELRLLPPPPSSSSSSPSSAWDVQAMPTLAHLPPHPHHHHHHQMMMMMPPPCTDTQPLLPLEMQQQPQPAPPSGAQPIPSASETSSLRETASPQRLPYCIEFHRLLPAGSGLTTHSLTQQPRPGPSCLKRPSLPSLEESQTAVSLKDLQPPPAGDDLQPLLPLVKLQPPPSFRGTPVAPPTQGCSSAASSSATFGEERLACSAPDCGAPSSNEATTSFIVSDDGQSTRPSSQGRRKSSSGSSQGAPASSGDYHGHSSSSAGYRSPISGRTPSAAIPRPALQQKGKGVSSPSFPGKQAQIAPTGRRGSKGKQVSFSDDETPPPPPPAASGKNEKRCAQLFSDVDSAPPILSSCPPKGAAPSGSPTRTAEAGSPCPAAPRLLPPGTPEGRSAPRELGSPAKPPRGAAPRSSPLSREAPGGPRISLDPSGLLLGGAQEMLRQEKPRPPPKQAALLQQPRQETHKPVGTLDNPRVPVKPVTSLVHDSHRRESHHREGFPSSPNHQQSSV